MAPKAAKRDLQQLKAAMRVLREEDGETYGEVVEEHCGTIAALLLEPRHAIQQRSAKKLHDAVTDEVRRAMNPPPPTQEEIDAIYAVWTYSETPEQLAMFGELVGADMDDPLTDRDFWIGDAFDWLVEEGVASTGYIDLDAELRDD